MPSLNSHADIIGDWQLLLDAGERSPEILPGIETERQTLAQFLADVRALKARQEELTALRQQVTQQLKESVAKGKDAAIQYRAVVKAKFGPRTERLVHFNMAPLRKRPRKRKEPTDGEEPGTQSSSSPVKTV
jgi:hypothetical protein